MSRAGRAVKNAVRPSPGTIFRSPVHFLAFGFGTGLAPVAPGTFGTLAALPFWWALVPGSWPVYLPVLAALFLAGCWLCGESSRRLGVHDHGGIVFDEIVGFLIAALPLIPVWGHSTPFDLARLAMAFALFRLFDIWKPWPIAALDRTVHGGTGIMLDDVVAGVYAAALLQGLLWSFGEALQ